MRFKAEPSGMRGDRFVREAQFVPVTDLPLSTVCQAANGARERLSRLFGRELTLDVFAPVLLPQDSGSIVFGDSAWFVAAGSQCDTYIVFRERDGHRLAAGAFGEEQSSDTGPFSVLEARALARIAEELARLCTPFSGDVRSVRRAETHATPPPCVTYFELRIAAPVDAVIGVGLSKDPGLTAGGCIDRAMLGGVPLELRAQFGEARIDARDIARWRVGTTVRLDTKIGAPTTLRVGPLVVAVGECGVHAQNHAVSVLSSPLSEAGR